MTTKPTIEKRTDAAAYGLAAYGVAKEGRADYDITEDMAIDLITDLLHLLNLGSGNPLQALETAKMHFEAEAPAKGGAR